jgi:hypothetical protein
MKLDAKDFKHLQWAIILLLVMGLVGGGAVWYSRQLKLIEDKAYKEAVAAQKDIQSKLARASEEQNELRDKIGRFQALKARGYIGPERRLDWVETVARIKAARRIPKLDYELAAQVPVDSAILPGGSAAGGFNVMTSQMHLRLHLLHEVELLTFLAELGDAVPAIVQARSCTIERMGSGDSSRGNNAQLTADCTLEWITVREGK